MRTLTLSLTLLLASAAFAAADKPTSSPAQLSFDKLSALSGDWQGKTSAGKAIEISIQPISGGHVIMQTDHTDENMVTMYHLDGNRLMMTHYCAANNEPRMTAKLPAQSDRLEFSFVDGTNIANPKVGHMHNMVMTFHDENHFSEQWFYHKDGKEAFSEVFEFERKH